MQTKELLKQRMKEKIDQVRIKQLETQLQSVMKMVKIGEKLHWCYEYDCDKTFKTFLQNIKGLIKY